MSYNKKSINNTKVKIYKIDHYYTLNHFEQCLLIRSDIEIVKLIKILASIQFKFEELIDESVSVDENHMLSILKEFYKVEDVKEKYKKYLPYTQINNEEWEIVNTFNIPNTNLKVIQIDLYGARESCCGSNYKEIMKEALPISKNFELTIKNFKSFYSS